MAAIDFSEWGFEAALADFPRPFRDIATVGTAMRQLMGAGLAELLPPGSGKTLERWRALSSVAAFDLSLAKIYESHTDAVAIMAELDAGEPEGLCGVWAAESPGARVLISEDRLSGRKAWCSGAPIVDSAVITAWTPDGQAVLAHVRLRQPGVAVENRGWNAVGMATSQSVAVVFENAEAKMIGDAGDYVARPGFWHGGAGIAAVWYGAAAAIAGTLAISRNVASDPHAAAHLGAVDVSLRAARALLIETAAWIDAHPQADAAGAALRLRACAEAASNDVLFRTGRALGPGPLCTDAVHAQRCADLPVFLRQSHAEHDLAALGRIVAGDCGGWKLES